MLDLDPEMMEIVLHIRPHKTGARIDELVAAAAGLAAADLEWGDRHDQAHAASSERRQATSASGWSTITWWWASGMSIRGVPGRTSARRRSAIMPPVRSDSAPRTKEIGRAHV